jgi:hypothetical protein
MKGGLTVPEELGERAAMRMVELQAIVEELAISLAKTDNQIQSIEKMNGSTDRECEAC